MIRDIVAGDIDAVARLHAACFAEKWGVPAMERLLEMPGTVAVVCNDESGRLTGFAIARAAGGDADILTIGVDPAQRRKRYGKALLNAIVTRLRALDVEALFIEVDLDNEAAVAFYDAAGFVRIGVRKSYYFRGERGRGDAASMRLALSQ